MSMSLMWSANARLLICGLTFSSLQPLIIIYFAYNLSKKSTAKFKLIAFTCFFFRNNKKIYNFCIICQMNFTLIEVIFYLCVMTLLYMSFAWQFAVFLYISPSIHDNFRCIFSQQHEYIHLSHARLTTHWCGDRD